MRGRGWRRDKQLLHPPHASGKKGNSVFFLCYVTDMNSSQRFSTETLAHMSEFVYLWVPEYVPICISAHTELC